MPMTGSRRVLVRLAAASIASLLLVGAAGCGSSDAGSDATTTTRASGSALTERDAEHLAQVLFQNYQGGGAHVSVAADYSQDLSVAMEGDVDWAGHQGALTVTTTFADGRPQEVQDIIYTEDTVYTKATPAQANALAQAGHPGVEWIERTPDTENRPLDQVIGLVASLASTKPDNPRLVAQGDLTFDQTDQLDGVDTDVYTSPKKGTYWLAHDSGKLVRFQGRLPGFTGPVVVDVTRSGPVTVTPPAPATVADASLLE